MQLYNKSTILLLYSIGLTKLLQNENPPNVTLAKAAELSTIYLKSCNNVVDKICEHIEENFPSNVGKIKNFIQVFFFIVSRQSFVHADVEITRVLQYLQDSIESLIKLRSVEIKSMK